MSSTVEERFETRRRWDDAMALSRRLCECSSLLVVSSKEARVTAERTRVVSVSRRAERDDAAAGGVVEAEPGGVVEAEPGGDVQSFVVTGFVEDLPAHARYVEGRLWCSAEVAERAEVVVAMGETFDPGDGGPEVMASLDSTPTAALLTVMRAFSHVCSVALGLGHPVDDH
jgi:hypothetical protein